MTSIHAADQVQYVEYVVRLRVQSLQMFLVLHGAY